MEYIKNTLDFEIKNETVITFGKFDGLHRGHELLMEKLKEQSLKNGYKKVVFTFDIPPKASVYGIDAKVITTNEEKKYIFEKAGIDYLIECPFTKDVMNFPPEDFIGWIVEKLNVKCIVVGKDFRFGHNRAGDYHTLMELSSQLGYDIIVVEKVKDGERDISSTYIRQELSEGHLKKADQLLGYPFFIRGRVVQGNQIGRTIGIPTANLIIPEEKIVPPFGVYVSRVMIKGTEYGGVSNIGKKPTIEGNYPVGLETYIFDFESDIYGKEITVELLEFVRPERRFDSIGDLTAEMNKNIEFSKEYYKNITKMC